MTTITVPTTSANPQMLGWIAAAMAVLILGAAVAFSAPSVSAPIVPSNLTNEVNGTDTTPNSGFLQYAY